MKNEIEKETIKLTDVSQNEDGSIDLEFDMSDGFKDRFKEFHGLKRWSNKKFNEWVDENLSLFLKIDPDNGE